MSIVGNAPDAPHVMLSPNARKRVAPKGMIVPKESGVGTGAPTWGAVRPTTRIPLGPVGDAGACEHALAISAISARTEMVGRCRIN